LYYLDLDSKLIACSSSVSVFYQYYRLGHPFLQTLKLLVPEVNHITSLDCQLCQLGKHHRMSYAERVNKRANNLFTLVHLDV